MTTEDPISVSNFLLPVGIRVEVFEKSLTLSDSSTVIFPQRINEDLGLGLGKDPPREGGQGFRQKSGREYFPEGVLNSESGMKSV